ISHCTGWRRPQASAITSEALAPESLKTAARRSLDMPTTWSCAATPGRTPSRSRHGWPGGWSREGWRSTKPRPGSSPLTEGFGFLGFDLRRYPNGKLLIKPGATAIKRFRRRLAKEFRALRGANVAAVLAKIVPIVRGWVAYYRTVVSSRAFHVLSDYLWRLTYKWACWSHQNKPKRWIAGRYFRRFEKSRSDRWVFGDKDTGAYLPKPAWTDIVRHTLVKGGASPDDPALAGYWAQRRQKVKPPLDSYTVRLLSRQDGRCSLCGENLSSLPPARPGSPGALLHRGPLRTVHARSRAHGPSKPQRAVQHRLQDPAPHPPCLLRRSSGPFTEVFNLPFGSGICSRFASKAHLPHVSALAGTSTRLVIRPVIRASSGRRPGPAALAFLLPFSRRHSLPGHPVPPAEFRPSYDRPTAAPAHTRAWGADP